MLRRHHSAYRAAAAAATSDAAFAATSASVAFSLAATLAARCISAAAAAAGKVVLKYACKSFSHRKSSSYARTHTAGERTRVGASVGYRPLLAQFLELAGWLAGGWTG